MNILFLTSEFPTECKAGGLATYLSNIIDLLIKTTNHRVFVVTASAHNNNRLVICKELEIERVYVADIMDKTWSNSGVYLLQSYRLNKRVKKIIEAETIDVIQYSNYMAVGFFLPRGVRRICRISSDSILWREAHKKDFELRKNINNLQLEDWIEYFSIMRADKIFDPSKYVGKIIEKRVHKQVTVIESPYTRMIDKIDDSTYQERLKGKKYVLFHSTLSRVKGIHILGQCIHSLLVKYTDLFFVFAGQDFQIEMNDRLINSMTFINKVSGPYRDRVIYLGTLDRSKLYSVIDHAFCCLQISIIDNFPNSCVEAMALGKVVIATKGSGCEQLIKNGINGFLIKNNSGDALRNVLSKLLEMSDEQVQKIGECAARSIEKQLDPNRILRKLLLIYDCND